MNQGNKIYCQYKVLVEHDVLSLSCEIQRSDKQLSECVCGCLTISVNVLLKRNKFCLIHAMGMLGITACN